MNTRVDYDTWKTTDTFGEADANREVAIEYIMENLSDEEIDREISNMITCEEESAIYAASVLRMERPTSWLVQEAKRRAAEISYDEDGPPGYDYNEEDDYFANHPYFGED